MCYEVALFGFQTKTLYTTYDISIVMPKVTGIVFDESDFELINKIKKQTGISTTKDTLRYALRKSLGEL